MGWPSSVTEFLSCHLKHHEQNLGKVQIYQGDGGGGGVARKTRKNFIFLALPLDAIQPRSLFTAYSVQRYLLIFFFLCHLSAGVKLRRHGRVACQSELRGGRQGQCGVRGVALSERAECWDRYRKNQRPQLQS